MHFVPRGIRLGGKTFRVIRDAESFNSRGDVPIPRKQNEPVGRPFSGTCRTVIVSREWIRCFSIVWLSSGHDSERDELFTLRGILTCL